MSDERTDPGATPQTETLRSLRYLLGGESGDYREERHDDGTVTVWVAEIARGGAITVLRDGTLTGYDSTERQGPNAALTCLTDKALRTVRSALDDAAYYRLGDDAADASEIEEDDERELFLDYRDLLAELGGPVA